MSERMRMGRTDRRNNIVIKEVIFGEQNLKEGVAALLSNKELYLCFMDLQKAFDKVLRKLNWAVLRKRDILDKLNQESERFITPMGVRPGGILSPLLFIILMNEQLYFCQRHYTDGGIEKTLQQELNNWYEILEEDGMKLDATKSNVMVVEKEKKKINIRVENTEIEQVLGGY
ncbi:uncharacterized protein LOC135128197 [Zophobas morio]|uniref:uncharacterized protein LOC135128197 n=1 Tax=Zophobas morio TaxID=2755281 RepID=UPI003082724B